MQVAQQRMIVDIQLEQAHRLREFN